MMTTTGLIYTPRDVGGHQIRSELDSGEVTAHDMGQGPDKQCFGHPGHTFD